MRPALWHAIIIAAIVIFTALESATTSAFDFRAFYCAGAAVQQHANPYRTEPLHSCERDRTDGYFAAFSRAVALPAPLPGYDIAIFAPLSRLPFVAAKVVWNIVITIAIGIALLALVRLTGISFLAVFSALWLSFLLPSLQFGELIPLAVAAICVAALFAHQGRWAAAGVASAVALVEPHLGLPVCIALAFWAPKARMTLLACAAALALISIRTLGIAQNVEYFSTVLPLHALSEIGSDAQLSLSVVLHYLGIADTTALRIGAIWYAAVVVLAVYASRALARRCSDGAFLIAVPAALAVVGGSFIHVTDMVAALPLAMLAYARIPQYRLAFIGAIILLALPWWHLALLLHQRQYEIVPMTAAVGLYLAWDLSRRNVRFALGWSAAVLAALVGSNAWYVASSDAYHRTAPPVHIAIDRAYPEASWAWMNARFISTGLPASWVLRAPDWLGLLLLGGGLAAFIKRSSPLEPEADSADIRLDVASVES